MRVDMMLNDTDFGEQLKDWKKVIKNDKDTEVNEMIEQIKEVIRYTESKLNESKEKTDENGNLVLKVPSEDGKSTISVNVLEKMQQISELLDGRLTIPEIDNFFTKFFKQEEVMQDVLKRFKDGKDNEKIKEYLKEENKKLKDRREKKNRIFKDTEEPYRKVKEIRNLMGNLTNYNNLDGDSDNVIDGLKKFGIPLGKDTVIVAGTTKTTTAAYVSNNVSDIKDRLQLKLQIEKDQIKNRAQNDPDFEENHMDEYLRNLESSIYQLDYQISANEKLIDNMENFINPELSGDLATYKKLIDSGIAYNKIGKKTIDGIEYVGYLNDRDEFVYTDKDGNIVTTNRDGSTAYRPDDIKHTDMYAKQTELENAWNSRRTGPAMTDEQINAKLASYGITEDEIRNKIIEKKLHEIGVDTDPAKEDFYPTLSPAEAKEAVKAYIADNLLNPTDKENKWIEAALSEGYKNEDYDTLSDSDKREVLDLYAMQKILGNSVVKADDYKNFIGITDFDEAFDNGEFDNEIQKEIKKLIEENGKIDETKLKNLLGSDYKKPRLIKNRKNLHGKMKTLIEEKAKENLKNMFEDYRDNIKTVMKTEAKEQLREDMVKAIIDPEVENMKREIVADREKRSYIQNGLNDFVKTKVGEIADAHRKDEGLMQGMSTILKEDGRAIYNQHRTDDATIAVLAHCMKRAVKEKGKYFSDGEIKAVDKTTKVDTSYTMPELDERD